jgi:hypothetical protein
MFFNLILEALPVVFNFLQAATAPSGALTEDQFNQQIALEAVRHNPANGLVGILVPISLFAMIAVIAWLAMRQRQARLRIKAEFHKQLLEKFSTGREFADFLESKGSQRFLDELWAQKTNSRERFLRAGVVLTMAGLALTGLSWIKKDLIILGVILLAIGGGYLISTWISYRMAGKPNLPDNTHPENTLIS